MKKIMRGLVIVLLVVSGTMLLAGAANAKLSIPEKEQAQTIVAILELLSFVTAIAIVWFVWHISKRDSKNRKSKQADQ